MRYSQSTLNAFFVLALVPVAQASIYAMADGVNFNALARQKAQKRAQQHQYRDLVRNPFRLFKRQESDPGIPIPTLPPISNTSTITPPETTTADATSSLTTLEPTSTDDDLSTTTTSIDAETTEPSETETTTTDASSTITEDITSTTDTASEETSIISPSSDETASETSTEVISTTEGTTEVETTTIRTTLDTSVKSAFTTAWSTSTFTLPNGAVGTVTEYLVVVPTMSTTRAQNPQESETATGTASLHTNAAGLYTPGPVPMVAMMAVLGYVGGAAF